MRASTPPSDVWPQPLGAEDGLTEDDPRMMQPAEQPLSKRRAAQRGQAMIEYSVINWLLIVALIVGANTALFPGPQAQRTLVELMLEAFQTYLDSYFFVLSLPFP